MARARRVVFRRASRAPRSLLLVVGAAVFLVAWAFVGLDWFRALLVAAIAVAAWMTGRAALDARRPRILADAGGIEAVAAGARVRIAWGDVAAVVPRRAEVPVPGGVADLRYVIVSDGKGRRLAFSDLSLIRHRRVVVDAAEPLVVLDVADPEILLAIIARWTGQGGILDAPGPTVATAPAAGAEAQADGQPGADPAGTPVVAPEARPGTGSGAGRDADRKPVKVDLAGLGALVLKLGGKLVTAVGGLVKLVKPGLAVLTGGIYAVLFDWKFALLLMGMLLFHELGHVYAMRRSGLNVKGVYFIPFLGAAAVTDDTWRTRREQAYIALNGPFWGFLLTLPVFVMYLAWGKVHPSLPAVAAWWSLLNLFNLLPINPLDGGRVVSALGYSIGSRLGVALSGAAFAASLVIALALEVHLFAIVGLFGLMEFLGELEASRAAHKLSLASVGPSFGEVALTRLRLLARPRFSLRDEMRLQAFEARRFRRLLLLSRVAPMSASGVAAWGIAYLGLVAAYVAIMIVVSGDPAASVALDVLR